MSLQMKPLGDRVIVRPVTAEQTLASGIVLPEIASEKPQHGEVLAVGDGRVLDNGTKLPMEVKVGDKVLYSKYSGTEFKYNDEELLIMNERDIHAIL
ncbi:MAG: co-chaperone GroES [Clostridiales bacterium]|nr:co-chaperone GroES [Clostridiales bacterium]